MRGEQEKDADPLREARSSVNVLHVNNVDLHGRRFNGYDLLSSMATRGIHGRQAVLSKLSHDPNVVLLRDERWDEELQQALCRVELRHSMNDLLFPWGALLAETSVFRNADVVHYHLIHNQMISLFDLPDLFRRKPSVWTFHDPWPFTGHCIHPRECEGWLEGCADCPRPDAPFAIGEGGAGRMWRVKQRVFAEIHPDIVVASRFMLDMAQRSPFTSHLQRIHHIPFGIETDTFLPDHEKPASRARLGIPDDDFVVLFRSASAEAKGLTHIIKALAAKPPSRPTTLLTLDRKHLVKSLSSHYNIVELGWVESQSRLARAFSACDVFLMPSTAEAFGLMALEAMAAGRPTVCFEGTSLPSITHAPDCGIAVPMGDHPALRAAIDDLSRNPDEARRRGELGRTIAAEEHGQAAYLDTLASLYEDLLSRTC